MNLFKHLISLLKPDSATENTSMTVPRDRASSSAQSLGSKMRAGHDALVKSRPANLEERYRILEDARELDQIFHRLAAPLFNLCDAVSTKMRQSSSPRTVLRELGTTSDRRSYIYMKPMSADGILMERSGAGWRLSRAEKIIGQSLFMRSHQSPWDIATIWKDPLGEGMTRVQSQRFGHDLMSIHEYERRLVAGLDDLFSNGAEH